MAQDVADRVLVLEGEVKGVRMTVANHDARLKPLEHDHTELQQLRRDFDRWSGRLLGAIAVVGFLVTLLGVLGRFWPH